MVRRRIQLSAVMVIPLIAVLFGSAGAAQPVLPAFVLTGPTRGSVGNELAVGVTATAPEVSTRATTLTFVLSRDRTSDAKDLKLAGKAVIPALQAKARQSVVAMLAIPLSTRPGAVFVIGCTTDGSDCSASGTKVQLTQNAVTTDDLVQTAVEQGTLDASTGLVYRVYGAFGDPRLPRKFAGEPTDGTAAMEDAIADWSTLPKPAQEAIRPYLLPPAAQGSWVDQSRPSGALIEGETTARSCEGTRAAPDWENIPAASGKVRLWWSSSDSELGKKVKSYVDEVSRFYADFKALLGREPLSDATVDKQCFHGVDGALDVYFVSSKELHRGYDPSRSIRGHAVPYPPGCPHTPAFLEVGDFAPLSTVAHEIFHAFQFAFDLSSCREFRAFNEGTATWAAKHELPTDPESWTGMVRDPRVSFNEESYALWPFDLYLEHVQGSNIFKRLYNAFERDPLLDALDLTLRGGLEKTWSAFTPYGWNRDPLKALGTWGHIAAVPPDNAPKQLAIGGLTRRTLNLPISLPSGMTRQYRWLEVADKNIRELKFNNSLAGVPHAAVWAFVKTSSGWMPPQDWSRRKKITFCRDKKSEDVSELVIMYANTDYEDLEPPQPSQQPTLDLRNSCDGLPYYYKVLKGSFTTTVEGNFAATHPCRDTYHGKYTFSGTLAAPTGVVGEISKDPVFGGITGSIPFTAPAKKVFDIFHGCQPDPDHVLEWIPCDVQPADVIPDGGTWDSGIYAIEGSAEASTITATWDVPQSDPNLGIPEPYACDVQAWAPGPDSADIQQQIPMATLASTDPIDLVFTGTYSEKGTTLDMKPADFTTSWTITMTIQRVDKNGDPLE